MPHRQLTYARAQPLKVSSCFSHQTTGQTSPLDWATLALLCATIFPLNLLSHLSEVGALDIIIIIILRVAAREKLSSFLPMRTTREPCKELDESAAFRAQLSQSSSEVKCGAVD